MDQLSELFQPIIDFVLGNIGIVVFAIFVLSGFLGRGDKKKDPQETSQAPQRPVRQEGEADDRPLAERLAEAFGVEIPEEQARPQPQTQPQQTRDERYGSEGRRSTVRRNVQEEYPQLFGGPSMFDRDRQEAEDSSWGFDETEWGTTFERNEEQWGSANQWGNTFPERKSSEPRIEWPG